MKQFFENSLRNTVNHNFGTISHNFGTISPESDRNQLIGSEVCTSVVAQPHTQSTREKASDTSEKHAESRLVDVFRIKRPLNGYTFLEGGSWESPGTFSPITGHVLK